ncbi:MAG: PKD domain-containing protein [Flavobacteriales bacterium]|nr:PKD domain-containing protein [Flavobacteriales bacterium]
MRKLLFLLFLSGLVTVEYSCKEDEPVPVPTADFAFTGGGCTAPCAVLFENRSKDASSYLWEFGDGTTSTEMNPTKTYNEGGTYTVVLTATGEGGTNKASKQLLIQQSTQSQLPTADFTFSGAGTAPCNVSFTNTSTNATTYNWDFGDGSSSTSANPSHLYSKGGAYSVILTASNAAGNNKITKIVNIADAPTKVKITRITVTDMPFSDGSGSGWDLFNGPDVFFKITDEADNVLFDATASRFSDVTPGDLPLSWDFTVPFEITDFNISRFIDLWDFDTPDADDLIGYVGFLMEDYTSGANAYPSSVTATQDGITLKLDLVWQ